MNARALLDTLSAAGLRVGISAAGDMLELTGKRPPAHLLDEIRACKPDLLEELQGVGAVSSANGIISSFLPPLEALPPRLADMVQEAQAGRLQRGAVKLTSGLATDLNAYVVAWGQAWPQDRAHTLRRLEEAYRATVNP